MSGPRSFRQRNEDFQRPRHFKDGRTIALDNGGGLRRNNGRAAEANAASRVLQSARFLIELKAGPSVLPFPKAP